ncbi:hypothetical protein JN531_001470 [Flagellatimonas centrodinii]|uniref:hypothetical protein n=1 Tax=Flagellatimonas centrodinii TaxID=2806210 RepID=UPI001FEEC82E|nr:hypothetical protein [Flagellatimonas centrodinii]ULQ46968.1 hypothetical protein JN531_001470 [Flagellatimonas centrodinii]
MPSSTPTTGTTVRIRFGRLRGRLGEVLRIEGRHASVACAGSRPVLLPIAELEVVL